MCYKCCICYRPIHNFLSILKLFGPLQSCLDCILSPCWSGMLLAGMSYLNVRGCHRSNATMRKIGRMSSRMQQQERTALKRQPGFNRWTVLKWSGFKPSKQMVLKRSSRPWTTLKLLAFTCGFQNIQPALKPLHGFEAGQVSNRSITYSLLYIP